MKWNEQDCMVRMRTREWPMIEHGPFFFIVTVLSNVEVYWKTDISHFNWVIKQNKQEHSKSAYLRQGECGPDHESESAVRIRTQDPYNFLILAGTSLS